MNNFKSLILDDDPFVQDLLQNKLDQYPPEGELLSMVISGIEGLEKIKDPTRFNFFKGRIG
jgi:two-component system LytT family response regulator